MLPLILLAVLCGIWIGWVSPSILTVFACAVALDFVIPLPNGLQPDPTWKMWLDRIMAEGGQHYFPAKSLLLAKIDHEKSYLLTAWPHGLVSGGQHYGFCDFEEQYGVYPVYAGASVLKCVPFVRRFLHKAGFVPATKCDMSRLLNVKQYGPSYPYNVVHLAPGGIQEMFYTPASAEHEQIVISKRKGFIKLALQTGCDIIPLYSFGANQTYGRWAGPDSVLCKLSSALRMSIVPWYGRWHLPLGLLPCKTPVLTAMGPVFEIPVVDKVTDELVATVHADFCKALRKLFDEYKEVYVKDMGADPAWLTRKLKFEDE
jgi:hypothetical protein